MLIRAPDCVLKINLRGSDVVVAASKSDFEFLDQGVAEVTFKCLIDVLLNS